VADYRRPGVYIEEKLATSPFESANATAVACFIGVASKGEPFAAIRCDSWSDFVQKFGGFDLVPFDNAGTTGAVLSYLPYAVYSYFQNGGRGLYVVRVLPVAESARGDISEVDIAAVTTGNAFTIQANGAGEWGDNVDVVIEQQASVGTAPNSRLIFSIAVLVNGARVETFSNLSMGGIEGTRPVAAALNDSIAGSRYITVTNQNSTLDPKTGQSHLDGGADPALPASTDLISSDATDAVTTIEGPVIAAFQPFIGANGSVIMPPVQAISGFTGERSDIICLWDGDPASLLTSPKADVLSKAAQLGTSDSYSAIYTPWIVTPDPARAGGTISVPPSGAVAGVMSRIDVTQGVWRTPAGAPASITNALSTELKYSETDQGELNYNNVNVIRPLIGAGVCIMGGRSRKLWGVDRYIAPRRTLIFIKETLRRATSFAVFENNDSHLWSALRQTANSILNPIWEQGGLKGTSANEAFFVRCDSSINTPQVIQSGEVRMEIGVALQYPAEFVVIRISQYDSGSSFAVEGIVTG